MSVKLYVVRWPRVTEPGNDEVAFLSLERALVRFGVLIERYENASGRNLQIDWSSIDGGRDLELGSYVVAFLEGGDMVGDAKVWIQAIRQFNYST